MSNTAKWTKIRGNRVPKTGIVVAGSYRNGEWSTSSMCLTGYPPWADSDRTHYCRLPTPPPYPQRSRKAKGVV